MSIENTNDIELGHTTDQKQRILKADSKGEDDAYANEYNMLCLDTYEDDKKEWGISRYCCIPVILVTGMIIITFYTLVDTAFLYRRHRACRDALINDRTYGTVVSSSQDFVEYNISAKETCKVPNRGQMAVVGSSYAIYRSNIGTCSQDIEKDGCGEDRIGLVYMIIFFVAPITCIIMVSIATKIEPPVRSVLWRLREAWHRYHGYDQL